MHTWTKSACIVLACIILPAVVAAGMTGSVQPAQASTRTASSTEVVLTSTLSVATAPGKAACRAARYVVQPGDTLSGIAARYAVRGGWPALYGANRRRIGSDPNVILPGTSLLLPGQRAPDRYWVLPGDTLAAIAAMLAVRGGWPALYAANRHVIGPDPNVIRPGAVLTVPRPAAPSPAAPRPAGRPALPPSATAGAGHHPRPGRTGAPSAAALPQGLKTLLPAVGAVLVAAFLAGLVLAARRRRDRGGRSRSVAAAVRSVAAVARVHPAAVAVPSAVLATGIVLFTLVNSATVRVVPPPGVSGPGSVYAARPGTGQPHHSLQPRRPGQPALPGSRVRIASPMPMPSAVPWARRGRASQEGRNLLSHLPGGGLVRDVRQVPWSAATAAAGSRGADQ